MLPRRHLIAVLALSVAAIALMAPAGALGKVTTKRIFFQAPPVTAATPIFSGGGLVLEATCDSGEDLGVTVSTTADGATLHANRHGTNSADLLYNEEETFDVAETFDLFTFLGGPDNQVAGQIVYGRPDGRWVTIDWTAFEDPISSLNNCLFAGVAQIANRKRDRGSRRRIDYRATTDAPAKRVLDRGGLRLTASCTSGTPELRARSSVDDSTIHANRQSGVGAGHFEEDDLDAGQSVALLAGLGTGDSLAGQVVFATPTGRTVSADLLSEQEDAFGLACVIGGTARVAGRDSPGRVFFRRAEGDDDPGDRSIFRPFFDRGFFSLRGSCASDATQAIEAVSNQAAVTGVSSHGTSADGAVFGGGSSGGSIAYAPLTDDASGHGVTAAANGAVASVDWLAEDGGDGFGGGPDCLFAGTADVLKP